MNISILSKLFLAVLTPKIGFSPFFKPVKINIVSISPYNAVSVDFFVSPEIFWDHYIIEYSQCNKKISLKIFYGWLWDETIWGYTASALDILLDVFHIGSVMKALGHHGANYIRSSLANITIYWKSFQSSWSYLYY